MSEWPSGSSFRARCIYCGAGHPDSYSHCPNTGKPLTAGQALVGRIIADRYRIVGLLGEGGMGAVYVAEHLLIGRKVALKRLHPELAAEDRAVLRFQREARAAAATGHENIVDVLDLGFAEDGAPFLVMEYLKGDTLGQVIAREGKLAPERACFVVGQVLAALAAVHRMGVVHRDLKPDNIFLTRRTGRTDYVKVLDFGVSKMRRDEPDHLQLTRTGVMLGTPYYMSPEQARGEPFDYRVDLFAAGVILYQALAGRLPFFEDNYHALLQSILACEPPRLDQVAPHVDPALARIVHGALTRAPADRYPHARAMLEALVPYGAVDPGEEEAVDSETPAADVPHVAGTKGHGLGPAGRRRGSGDEGGAKPLVPTTERAEGARSAGTGPPRTAPRAPPSPSAGGGPRVDGSSRRPAAPRAAHRADAASHTDAALTPPPRNTPSAEQRAEAHVKGSLVTAALEHVEEHFGPSALERVRTALEPKTRQRLGGVILPMAWLPLRCYADLLSEIEQQLGRGDGTHAMRVGETTGHRDLPQTHRLFVQTATPSMAVSRLPQLWRSYHDRGAIEVQQTSGGGCRLELWELLPASWLHAMATAGFFRALLQLTGARHVQAAVTASAAHGADRTVIELQWD